MSHDLFFEDYMRYMRNAWMLEQKKKGVAEYMDVVTGDYLMDNVPIYDVTDRQFAGINDVIQDLWYNDDPIDNPKAQLRRDWRAQPVDRAPKMSYFEQLASYKGLHDRWDRETWLYVWLVHRITGSAASYVDDHGYRNTIIPELAQFDTIKEMADFIYSYNKGFYTSAGCQIPGFPKLDNQAILKEGHRHDYNILTSKAQGKLFLCTCGPRLVKEIDHQFDLIDQGSRKKFGHKTVHASDGSEKIEGLMDFVCTYNKNRQFNQFAFQYALFAADVSDYLPQYVDPDSHVHYGTNSVKALKVLTEGGRSKDFDVTAKRVKDEYLRRYGIHLRYKGIENSLCDYTKYLKEQVPDFNVLAPGVDRSLLVRDTSIVSRELGQEKGFP